MTQKERDNRKTDRAWDILYHRLESDGLIAESNRPRRSSRVTTLGWTVAAAVLLCIYLSVTYFDRNEKEVDRNLLSQQNKEVITLVKTLEDGSIIYLAGNATIHYPEHFQPDKREVILTGNALFDITGNRQRPFLIETEDTKIEVLGTAFNVKSDGKQPFELSVQRGKVKVTLKDNGQDVYVEAGETVTLDSHKLHVNPTQDKEQFAQYTKQIRFKDERLADILRVINLYEPDVRLQTTPALANRTLTVTFSDNSPETMIELICLALNLKCTRENNILTLHEN